MLNTEQELFEYLKSNYFADLVESRNKFSRWDCYSPKHKCRIELKCRKTHYDTLVIERKKYYALMDKSIRHNDRPLYINSTPQGVYVFVLNEMEEPKWFLKSMPETTTFKSRAFVKKEVAMLSISEAFELNK